MRFANHLNYVNVYVLGEKANREPTMSIGIFGIAPWIAKRHLVCVSECHVILRYSTVYTKYAQYKYMS